MEAATSPVLRVATDGDDAAGRALLTAAGLPLEGFASTWRRWVAERDGRLEGVVALERHHPGSEPTVYLLRSLAVREGARGTGLGAALVRAALAGADAQEGAPARVALLTQTAVGYFERFGFTRTTREALPPALESSELAGACPTSAAAYWRA